MRRSRWVSVHALRGAALAVALEAQGCGSPPELDDQLRTIASWTATLQLAMAQHREGAITTRYLAQLDDAATRALAEARRAIPEAEHDRRDLARADAALDSLDRAIRLVDAEEHR